jgi:hypothetical protein
VLVGSDTAYLLAVYLGMLDADFHIDTTDAPELAERIRGLAARYNRAIE